MPRRPNNPDWIDWSKSEAKKRLLNDLESGFLPLEDDIITAEVAWEHYQHMIEFLPVVFSQFEKRLKDHRAQVKKRKSHIDDQLAALQHDRQLHPANEIDSRGRRVFYLSPAKPLLEEDVQNERHLELGTEDLYWSREEYWDDNWTLKEFKRRLYQEIGRQKFLYYLECKRAKKEADLEDALVPDLPGFDVLLGEIDGETDNDESDGDT